MAEFNFSFWSDEVGDQTQIDIILPVGTQYEDSIQPGEKFQTLWLLHGEGENATSWRRMTALERIALENRLAVVMPETWNNYYADIDQGPHYFSYISQELPEFLRKYFPLSEKREDNFICGASYGGIGAAKCAFAQPENYAAAGFFSCGPLAFGTNGVPVPEEERSKMEIVYDDIDRLDGSVEDVIFLLKEALKAGKKLPLLFNSCGREDAAYDRYTLFNRLAGEAGAEVRCEERPGISGWQEKEAVLKRFIQLLPLKNRDCWTF